MDYFFGSHEGHLNAKAEKIAQKYGAWHVNYTDPGTNRRRGWFACVNYGRPFDQAIEAAVMRDINAIGGFEKLTLSRDRRR